ncbi:MAG: hypothetical protein ABS36_16960 [Acidobacteria bacterium SCN 69-37]|nr:MAG: hypothetical protein ABS36_16960 [Acidobacteria bacterium SCN 69-37]
MNAHDQARLAATRFVLHDLQDGSFLVHDLLRDRVQLVETEAAMRLRSLQGGQLTPTSSQLAATTRSRIHELFARCRSSVTGTPSAARHAAVDVRQLSAEGWVVTERDILAQLAGAAIDEEPSIGSVAIITKDRYPTLRRCLLSVLRNRQHWSRQYRVVVLDDSEQPASRLLGARLADELSKEFATPIAYIGQDRKRHAVAAIASASGVDVDVLQFGLVGRQEIGAYPGANRNNFLLHAAGEMAVHLDDDVVCSISPTSESRPDRLALTDEAEPADCRFMRDALDPIRWTV